MGYPERLLSDAEEIASQFRPHWSGILKEGTLVILALVLAGLAAAQDAPVWLILGVVVLALVLVSRGLIRWTTTLYVVTNERVIYRAGLIAKKGKEIHLEVINDVEFKQTIIERIFGTGDLLIESAGTHGQSRYRDIPAPETVQSLIYKVREERMERMRRGPTSAHTTSESSASQLATLSRLHDEGKLTDAEFAAEKNKLLGGS